MRNKFGKRRNRPMKVKRSGNESVSGDESEMKVKKKLRKEEERRRRKEVKGELLREHRF